MEITEVGPEWRISIKRGRVMVSTIYCLSKQSLTNEIMYSVVYDLLLYNYFSPGSV